MGTRGPKSAASLAVTAASPVETIKRPDPPFELTEEQAREWRAVVGRMPADWFPRETHGLLIQYCRHVVSSRRVAGMIEQIESSLKDAVDGGADAVGVTLGSIEALDKLFKMQEREGRAISSLATRMRITQQATYDKSKKKPAQGKKPWE